MRDLITFNQLTERRLSGEYITERASVCFSIIMTRL